MQVKYSPQRSDDKIGYEFNGEIITITIGEVSDVFDFSTIPDGVMVTDEDNPVVTTLPINPIVSAKRVNGELFLELLYFYGENATHEELFPEWQVI